MKSLGTGTLLLYEKSPPSRAAWIEMFDMNELLRGDMVAAFTGGVD